MEPVDHLSPSASTGAASISDPVVFTARVHDASSPIRLVLVGELDLATAEDFMLAFNNLWQAGHRRIVVDLSELTFCDVRGLNALLRVHLLLESSDGHASFAHPGGTVRRLLRVSKLESVLDLHANDAYQSF